jgi:hypothetical protein
VLRPKIAIYLASPTASGMIITRRLHGEYPDNINDIKILETAVVREIQRNGLEGSLFRRI